jgi:Flp pilus assembly protein CpaB
MISITSANQLGTQMAAFGWTEEQVRAWAAAQSVGRMSMARVLRAFRDQLARA